MYRAFAVKWTGKPDLIEQYDSLQEGVDDILAHWHEDSSPLKLIYFVSLETGTIHATMACAEDTSLVHITWMDSQHTPELEVYKVVYLCKPDGSYLSTQINRIW